MKEVVIVVGLAGLGCVIIIINIIFGGLCSEASFALTISSFLLSSSLSTVCLSLLLLSSFLLSLVDCPSRGLCFSSSLLVLLKGMLIVELSPDCELVKSIFHPFDDPFDDGVTLVGFVVGLLKFLT